MGRRRLLMLVLVSVLALAVSSGGRATAAAEKAEGDAKAGGEEEKPIFRPPAEALDLSIWTLVVFVLLLFILGKWAWRPMLEALHKREQTIRGALEEAQLAREEAQRLRDQLQGEVNRAHETVREILDEARRDAQHTTEEMVARARSEIQSERDRLRREIETARDQALQELWNRTAELATIVSAKAIRRHLSPDDHRRLVDEALSELDHAGKERQRQVASVQA